VIGDTFDNNTNKNLIIDFSQVHAIDSRGLSGILIAHQMANMQDGFVIFVSVGNQVKGLLRLSNLDRQLYIANSINEVLKRKFQK